MQALARLSVLPLLFRRSRLARIAARANGGDAPDEYGSEGDADDGRFRVTDRLRRWSRARHFADAQTACRYAEATGGVVWERYLGPTGATNWWSLTDEECELMAAAARDVPARHEPAVAATAAASLV